MWRATFIPLIFLAMVTYCSGQTFQYSRGWTNGKRSDSRADTRSDELTDLMMDGDWEKKFEKCLFVMQRIAQVPYIRNVLLAANKQMGAGHRRVSPEDIDSLLLSDGNQFGGTRLKRRVDGMAT